MEEEKLNKGVEEIKKIIMTAEEKGHMLEAISSSPLPREKAVKSPYVIYAFMSKLRKKRLVYYGGVSCLVIVLGSVTVLASEKSLPGDITYPVKVNLVEPIHSKLIFSNVGRAHYQSNLAKERLIEAETLSQNNQLDTPRAQEINTLLEEHTRALNEAVSAIKEEKPDGEERGDTILTDFNTTLNAHTDELNFINDSRHQEKDQGQKDNEDN